MKKRTISILVIAALIFNLAAVDLSFAAKRGWVRNAQGEKTAYILSNGERATGFRIIAERGYVFSPQGKLMTGKVISEGRPYYIKNSEGMNSSKKWITFKNGSKVYNAGYGKLLTEVHKIKGYIYGFDQKGYMLKGRQMIDDQPYFFKKNGTAADRGWIRSSKSEEKLYYCTGGGELLSGLQDVEDRAYYFDRYGKMRTGKWYIDGYPYYFKDSNGMGPEREWITLVNGKNVYAAGYGTLLTGVNIIDGEVYGFGDDGYTLSGKQNLEDGLYYFDENGKAYPEGWINDEEGNPIYYSLGDGHIATGKYQIGSRTYHFDKEGNPIGYRIAEEGKNYFFHMDDTPYEKGWVRNDDGRGYMYCSRDGLLLTGYHIISNEAYYFDEKGELAFGKITIDGKPYYFSESKRGEGSRPGWIHFKSGLSVYTKGYGELVTGDYQIGNKMYHFNSRGYIRLKKKGIDVSAFQDKIDWKQVKSDGIEFALIRTGGRFGASGKIYDDSRYEYNMKNAIANGIDTGVYFFTQAVTTKEAVEEARYTCEKLKGYDIRYPVIIDTEYLKDGRHSDLSVKQRTAVVKAFCEEVKRQGYEPMVYANLNWLNKHLKMSELRDYKVWVAQYYDECQYKGDYNCWQYTSSGHVKGIEGRVDRNIWYEGDLVK